MPQVAVVAVVLLVFGVVGFQRGWLREVVTLGVLLLGWLILTALGWELVHAANQVALIVQFTFGGGFDAIDANAVLRQLRAAPLIDPRRPELFFAALFLLTIVVGYVGAQRLAPRPRALAAQLLGACAGAINGYVLTYVLLRYVSPDASLTLSLNLSTGGLADTLGRYLSTLVLGGVALAIVVALLSAARLRQSAGRRSRGAGPPGG